MADFKIANKITAGNEGGYSNDAHDHGGETFAGIARNYWPKWGGWPLIDSYKKQHGLTNINTLLHDAGMITFIQAFYKQNFWDVIKGDLINDQQIANQAYDMAVNSGTGASAKMLQRIANVAVDGSIGAMSIAAINGMPAQSFYTALIAARKAFYDNIIAKDPTQAKFRNSWYSRLTPYKL